MEYTKNILSIFLIACSLHGTAQYNTIKDSTLLRLEYHNILNDSVLEPFTSRVKQRDLQTGHSITIVHIGDSHVQGPIFPSAVRDGLQAAYGNAGHGFIFPYQVAGTNGNNLTRFYSDDSWHSVRNVKSDGKDNIGLSGILLETKDPTFELELKLKKELHDAREIEILSTHPSYFNISEQRLKKASKKQFTGDYINTYHKVKKGDNLSVLSRDNNTTVSELQKLNNLKNISIAIGQRLIVKQTAIEKTVLEETPVAPVLPTSLERINDFNYKLPLQPDALYITAANKQDVYSIDGFILRNNRPGVQYHSIGVNGAQFTDYTKFPRFFEQLAYLKPDLIILSLGTNESFSTTLTTQEFINMLSDFNTKLKDSGITAPVLATSPPPSLKDKKYPNTLATAYTEILKQESKLLGWGFYDLHNVAGSSTNMNTWYKRKLTASDRIHYNADGYTLLGALISDVLIQTIEK